MTADGLTKALLSNKFKEFVALVRVSRIEASNGEASDGKASNSKSNNGKAGGDDKNDGKFMANYYKEVKAEEVSFETEEAG